MWRHGQHVQGLVLMVERPDAEAAEELSACLTACVAKAQLQSLKLGVTARLNVGGWATAAHNLQRLRDPGQASHACTC